MKREKNMNTAARVAPESVKYRKGVPGYRRSHYQAEKNIKPGLFLSCVRVVNEYR